jgi:hypothetical protein
MSTTSVYEFPYSSARLVYTEYEYYATTVDLEYVEHSPDSWYSGTETSVRLSVQDINDIINFLTVARSKLIASQSLR